MSRQVTAALCAGRWRVSRSSGSFSVVPGLMPSRSSALITRSAKSGANASLVGQPSTAQAILFGEERVVRAVRPDCMVVRGGRRARWLHWVLAHVDPGQQLPQLFWAVATAARYGPHLSASAISPPRCTYTQLPSAAGCGSR